MSWLLALLSQDKSHMHSGVPSLRSWHRAPYWHSTSSQDVGLYHSGKKRRKFDVHVSPNLIMCVWMWMSTCGHADVNMNLGGLAKVRAQDCMQIKRDHQLLSCLISDTLWIMELDTDKAGPPIVKLFNFWHFINKVSLFHSHLCVGFHTWHKRFYVNDRAWIPSLAADVPVHSLQPTWAVSQNTDTGKNTMATLKWCYGVE